LSRDGSRLIKKLEAWDGQHADYLERICHAELRNPPRFAILLDLLGQWPKYQVALTWCMKCLHTSGYALNESDSLRLIVNAQRLDQWQSILHFLQLLPAMAIAENSRKQVEHLLRGWLVHENKFVRTWCYNGWAI